MKKNNKLFLYFLMSVMFVLLSACANADAEQNSNRFIVKAKNATKEFNLTEISISCLNFKLLDEKFEGQVIVDVREVHNATCGGDPKTHPRLFSIGFDESKNEIWSDAKSLLGQMEKLN